MIAWMDKGKGRGIEQKEVEAIGKRMKKGRGNRSTLPHEKWAETAETHTPVYTVKCEKGGELENQMIEKIPETEGEREYLNKSLAARHVKNRETSANIQSKGPPLFVRAVLEYAGVAEGRVSKLNYVVRFKSSDNGKDLSRSVKEAPVLIAGKP